MNTTYFLNLVAGNVFRTSTTPAIPQKYYVGLSTTAPTVAGTGYSEPSGKGYARVELTGLLAPVNGVVTNNTLIDFPESTGDWGTITYYLIFDSATVGSGNLLMYGVLTTPRRVEAETTMLIKKGYLKLTVRNP